MPVLDTVLNVTVVPQTKSMSCWAAAAATLLSWKNGIPTSELAAAQAAGPNFVAAFRSNTGLYGTEIGPLAAALGLKTEAPQNYTPGGYYNLLKAHGPLWVGTAIFSSTVVYRHVRILRGVTGDGSFDGSTAWIVDPAGGGRDYSQTITSFAKELEEIAKQDLGAGAELSPQVIRYP